MQPHPIQITGLATDRMVSAAELGALVEAAPDGSVGVATLLDLVAVDAGARRVHVTSADGSYSASIPLDDIIRRGVITVEADGNRLRVQDGSTLCWNVKAVGELRLTPTKDPDSVPDEPTH
jgi:hypothetical protein